MTKRKKDKYLDADKEAPEVKQGPPWTKVGVFQTFEEADKRRFEVVANEPTFNVKVKRCGTDGEQFMVKKREDPKLAKISKEIDEVSKKNSQKKNKKKPSKRIRKSS